MSGPRDIHAACRRCGWTFTVYAVPETPEYEGTDWFCPHCGASAKEVAPECDPLGTKWREITYSVSLLFVVGLAFDYGETVPSRKRLKEILAANVQDRINAADGVQADDITRFQVIDELVHGDEQKGESDGSDDVQDVPGGRGRGKGVQRGDAARPVHARARRLHGNDRRKA